MGFKITSLAPSVSKFKSILNKHLSYQNQNLDQKSGTYKVQSVWIRNIRYDFLDGVGYIVVFYFNIETTKSHQNPMGKRPTLWVFANEQDLTRMINQQSIGRFYVEEMSIKENIAGRGGNNQTQDVFIPMTWSEMGQLFQQYTENMKQAADRMVGFANGENTEMLKKAKTIQNRNETLRKNLYSPSIENRKNAYDDAKKGLDKALHTASFVKAGFTNPFKLITNIGKGVAKKQARKKIVKPIMDVSKENFIKKVGFDNIDKINEGINKGQQIIDGGRSINQYARKPTRLKKPALKQATNQLEELARKATRR